MRFEPGDRPPVLLIRIWSDFSAAACVKNKQARGRLCLRLGEGNGKCLVMRNIARPSRSTHLHTTEYNSGVISAG